MNTQTPGDCTREENAVETGGTTGNHIIHHPVGTTGDSTGMRMTRHPVATTAGQDSDVTTAGDATRMRAEGPTTVKLSTETTTANIVQTTVASKETPGEPEIDTREIDTREIGTREIETPSALYDFRRVQTRALSAGAVESSDTYRVIVQKTRHARRAQT